MNDAQIAEALRTIAAPDALSAVEEYELEDLGLITTDDGPYAQLTDEGRALLARAFDEVPS